MAETKRRPDAADRDDFDERDESEDTEQSEDRDDEERSGDSDTTDEGADDSKEGSDEDDSQQRPRTKQSDERRARLRQDRPRRKRRDDSERHGGNGGGKSKLKGPQAALSAAQQLVDLTGKEFEGIVGIAKADDGWTVEVEVLEMRRIPSTTDVLASYEVTVDRRGDLTGYQRKDRYVRGSAGEERR